MHSRILAVCAAAAAVFVVACSSTTDSSNTSPYSLAYHAGAPVNQGYSKTIVETHAISWYDSVAKKTVSALRFVGIGRCGCGALTDQVYFVCDSMGMGLVPPADSGSFSFKVNGDLNEAYMHGRLVIDSIIHGVDGYHIGFHARVKVGADSVDITQGSSFAPPAVTP